AGLTLGVVGFGRTGQAVAKLALGLGMPVIGYSPSRNDTEFAALGVRRAPSLDALLGAADAVSLHVPLTPATRGLIGARELRQMKPFAFLVNTSRSAVVDGEALVAALRAGELGGAGLDVFSYGGPAETDL